MTHVSAIHFYPVKSMAGISLESGRLDDLGLRGDRRWMLIDEGCRYVSQREVAHLCMVQPEFTPEGLRVSAPGMEPLVIRRGADGPEVEVAVWGDRCLAMEVGSAPSEWFSEYVGARVRLVYLPSDSTRRIDPSYDTRGRRTSFTDGFPLLFTSESSLADLNSRLKTPVPMNRFRPSVVISGPDAWAEDGWERLRINGVVYDVS
ncbi:MAG: MOSC domain-containing protein, partial [Gemmatimonadales bacterium]